MDFLIQSLYVKLVILMYCLSIMQLQMLHAQLHFVFNYATVYMVATSEISDRNQGLFLAYSWVGEGCYILFSYILMNAKIWITTIICTC
jgi:hypothetical protein